MVMRHGQSDIGQSTEILQIKARGKEMHTEDFVLEKSIFNNIFEKDIRRVFIYKKAERLAKAMHLIAPAFVESVALQNRIDAIAVGLVDAALLPPGAARSALSRELLTLSSILSIARVGGLLSSMNAELISREAHILLQEVAVYEEPRLFLDEAPTLSSIAKQALKKGSSEPKRIVSINPARVGPASGGKGHIKDRREAIMSVIRHKKQAHIKDISTVIRDVSEKTIQRELLALIVDGIVNKQGERRWSTYSLV